MVQEVERDARGAATSSEVVAAIRRRAGRRARGRRSTPWSCSARRPAQDFQRQGPAPGCRAAFLAGSLATVLDAGGETGAGDRPAAERGSPRTDPRELAGRRAGAPRPAVAGARSTRSRPLADYAARLARRSCELLHAVEAALGSRSPLDRFFDGLTLAELARFLGRAAGGAAGVRAAAGGGRSTGDHPALPRPALPLVPPPARPGEPGLQRAAARSACAGRWTPRRCAAPSRPWWTATRPCAPRSRSWTASRVQRVAERADGLPSSRRTPPAGARSAGERLARGGPPAVRPRGRPAAARRPLPRRGASTCSCVAFHHIVTDFWSLGRAARGARLALPARCTPTCLLPPACATPTVVALAAGAPGRARGRAAVGLVAASAWPASCRSSSLPHRPAAAAGPDLRAAPPCRAPSSARLTGGVQELGRARGRATPFVTLLAAFEACSTATPARTTCCWDRRPRPARTPRLRPASSATSSTPWCCAPDLAGDPAFRRFLGAARRDVLGAFEHQDFPFPLLVERLQPERDPGRSPLFQVIASAAGRAGRRPGPDRLRPRRAGRAWSWAGCAWSRSRWTWGSPSSTSPCRWARWAARLVAAFDYNTDLFDAVTVERLAEHFATLLEGIAADPERPLSALPLLTAAEERQLLVEVGTTRGPTSRARPASPISSRRRRRPRPRPRP